MLPTSRIGDLVLGKCKNHKKKKKVYIGVIMTGAPNVLVGMQPCARVTDLTIGKCGHIGIIITGSWRVLVNMSPAAQVTSKVLGKKLTASVITGFPTVLT